MDSAPLNITRALTLELIDASGTSTPLSSVLTYDVSDPYAVAASFTVAGATVCWVFARSLLLTGVFEPAGEGDVQVWPCLNAGGQAVTVIQLSSPEGEALVQASSTEVCEFLRRTEGLVALGAEAKYVDIDDAIAKLLG